MATSSDEPVSKLSELTLDEETDTAVAAGETLHADPITGEPGAHPAAVGVGALGAGAAGAAIGMIVGPIGAIIGAAIGAVAGGLAGHEVAVSSDEREAEPTSGLDAETTGSTTDAAGRPSSIAAVPAEQSLTVFPGSDLGAPAVMTEPATESEPLGNNFSAGPVAGTSGEAQNFTATDEPMSHAFTVGEDPADAVRTSAYYRYLGRLDSGRPGDELGDWVEAEREVSRF